MLITNGQAHARGRLTGLRQRSPRPIGRAWAGSCAISLRYASTAYDLGDRDHTHFIKITKIDTLIVRCWQSLKKAKYKLDRGERSADQSCKKVAQARWCASSCALVYAFTPPSSMIVIRSLVTTLRTQSGTASIAVELRAKPTAGGANAPPMGAVGAWPI